MHFGTRNTTQVDAGVLNMSQLAVCQNTDDNNNNNQGQMNEAAGEGGDVTIYR